MSERTATLLEADPDRSLLDAIAKLVDPVTGRYSFPPHAFFDGIRKVHAQGFQGSGQIIGIVDTGIDAAHPGLKDAILDARDFTTEGTPNDLHGHGTLVALIVRYVAPKARIISAKAFGKDGRARESALSAALQWIRTKSPTVVNLSGGIAEPDPARSFPSWLRGYVSRKGRGHWLVHLLRKHWFRACPVCQAADQLWKAGTVVCVAVGNDREHIICPGRGERGTLMLIGAASIAAGKPAVAGYSAYWPDLVAPEVHVVPGTSFSAPFVSGTSALLVEAAEVKSTASSPATLRRADIFFAARRFPDAIVAYERALNKDAHLAEHASLRIPIGSCLYCQALIYTPRMKLAFSYLYSGNAPAAAKLFADNVTIAPDFADACMNLGAALRNIPGRQPDAVTVYQRAIALAPDRAEACDGLGDTYLIGRALKEALAAFERSHELNPARPYPLQQLIRICLTLPDRDKARRYQEALAQLG